MMNSKEVLDFKAKTSIVAMALFTEQCKKQEAHKVIKWFERNANDFQKEELAFLVRELLYAIKIDCADPDEILTDVAIEIDEAYEDAYEKEGLNG